MADEPKLHAEGATQKQTVEVGHVHAAAKQSNGPLGSRPLRSGPVRSGPAVRGPVRSGKLLRGTVRSRQPTVVGIN